MYYRYTRMITRDEVGNECVEENYDSDDKGWLEEMRLVDHGTPLEGPKAATDEVIEEYLNSKIAAKEEEATESYYPPFTMGDYERDKGARVYPNYDQADDALDSIKHNYKEPSEKEMSDHRADRLKTFREKYLNEKRRADYYLSREQGMDSPEPTPQEDTDEMIDALERLDNKYDAVEAFNTLRRKIFAT